MAKAQRKRISYVLPLANSPGGHRLGVNGLAVDGDHSILYSGGRDGAICAWDLNFDLRPGAQDTAADSGSRALRKPRTTFRSQTQAHTHWVNDIVLAQNNTALVSASSDLTVRVWRPAADETSGPTTIGQHTDYVKCLATPSARADWVASGGLDRKIRLWDLAGAGKRLEIEVGDEDKGSEKGSVYALGASRSILASGGPESILRLWDERSGKRITKFMGHTDNVRGILINGEGNVVMTASSDQTVKVWSVTAGRCMHTLTMHNDSVWSLFSDDPQLGIFYSSDRSGLVVKTDVRGTLDEIDDGLSLAVAQETEGVSKVIACRDCIWTATSSSSINRWANVDTGDETRLPETWRRHRRASSTAAPPTGDFLSAGGGVSRNASSGTAVEIPSNSILRISNTATFPALQKADPEAATLLSASSVKGGSQLIEGDDSTTIPVYNLPEETIEGQHGLVKHKLLNDRRRVLTLDTAGDVLLWDLLKCVPVQTFGKRHLEDVEPEVNTMEAVAPWCSVDTRTGRLAVVLEEYNCFDAEMYADELVLDEPIDFKEDQRINLGKWVLRYIFAEFIDEQIRRDEAYRKELYQRQTGGALEQKLEASQASPLSIQIPAFGLMSWQPEPASASTTPRANGAHYPVPPGMAIGVATPAASLPTQPLPHVPEDGGGSVVGGGGGTLTKKTSHASNSNTSASAEKPPGDYFGASPVTPGGAVAASEDTSASPQPPENGDSAKVEGSGGAGITPKKSGSLFGKKFSSMSSSMSFGAKKRGRSLSASINNINGNSHSSNNNNIVESKAAAAAGSVGPAEPETTSEHSEESEKERAGKDVVDDNVYGVVQKMRHEYDRLFAAAAAPDAGCASLMTPSLPAETPTLKLPARTTVIIQEETSGGSADLYRGTVGTVGRPGGDLEAVERQGPPWLGELLLANRVPVKEPVKVSFVLLPWGDLLPGIAGSDGNSRLNANRMLRVKKILAYVAERMEVLPDADPTGAERERTGEGGGGTGGGGGGDDATGGPSRARSVASADDAAAVAPATSLKPEEYLELFCYDQKLPITMSLATLRAHVWKSGADVMLYYRSNGRVRIKGERREGEVA